MDDPFVALLVANVLSFAVFVLLAVWYAVPWLRRQPRAMALAPLLWVHAFRHVALQVFSAQRAGLPVSDALRDRIAYGDVVGMVLAVAAIVALRARARAAIPLVWIFALATAADLVATLAGGIRERLLAGVSGVTWLILVFYVPLLWVTLALVVWQLTTRRGEQMASGERSSPESRRASRPLWGKQ